MSQSKLDRQSPPEAVDVDAEVLEFRDHFDGKSPLDELVREGARRMLQSAIDLEVDSFIERHGDRRDDEGRRLVVKNGSGVAPVPLPSSGVIALGRSGAEFVNFGWS